MFVDRITESIAHFIGQFDLTNEAARPKSAFAEFDKAKQAKHENPALPDADVQLVERLDDRGFGPDIPYRESPPELFKLPPGNFAAFVPVPAPMPEFMSPGEPEEWHRVEQAHMGRRSPQLEIEPPGSVAVIVSQHITLSDKDYVDIGGSGLELNIDRSDADTLDAMLADAEELSPFTGLAPAAEGMVEYAIGARAAIDEWQAPTDIAGLTVVNETQIEGTYVNGIRLAEDEEAPDLDDYLNLLADDDEDDDDADDDDGVNGDGDVAVGGTAVGEGTFVANASVTFDAGSNTLINSATIATSWATSTVMAVAGDYLELNAIVQVNAASTGDNLTSAMNGWALESAESAGSFNIAMFQHKTSLSDEPQEPASGPAGFPSQWIVTRVEGDLTIVNELMQITFMQDNDVAVLSSSSVTATVTMGGNTAVNEISINELSYYYDLIVVGGSVFDLNIIRQMNLLVDNDLIGAVDGFETSGTATYSSDGNLLWNQAAIIEVGNDETILPMTAEYQNTIDKLAAGDDKIDTGILTDGAFAGLTGLRVLYVEGDVLNINHINQINLLGDSDTIALAMSDYAHVSDAAWTVGTGANQLVNFATIVDVEGTQKVYVGGEGYSDELLIQADLLSDDGPLIANDPDTVINEAIAFLSEDDLDAPASSDAGFVTSAMPHESQADVMQSVLA